MKSILQIINFRQVLIFLGKQYIYTSNIICIYISKVIFTTLEKSEKSDPKWTWGHNEFSTLENENRVKTRKSIRTKKYSGGQDQFWCNY